jgi:hypothetical protein
MSPNKYLASKRSDLPRAHLPFWAYRDSSGSGRFCEDSLHRLEPRIIGRENRLGSFEDLSQGAALFTSLATPPVCIIHPRKRRKVAHADVLNDRLRVGIQFVCLL